MLAGSAKDADHRRACGGGNVHETRVVADGRAGIGEKVNSFIDAGAAGDVNSA